MNLEQDATQGDIQAVPWHIDLQTPTPTTLVVAFAGEWQIGQDLPSFAECIEPQLTSSIATIGFDCRQLTAWDSGFVTLLRKIETYSARHSLTIDYAGLPAGAKRLLDMARIVPKQKNLPKHDETISHITLLGCETLTVLQHMLDMIKFFGDLSLSLLRLIRGKAQFLGGDLLLIMQRAGAESLAIVSLIGFLVGIILAFIGALQLEKFAAEIYVANLVTIGMVRELGCLMVAIVMAGQTGAAFAAQIGTMQVNQEIDALKTLVISPIDFLVLPRALALILMMPLLVIYASFLGIMGGAVIGCTMLDLTWAAYINQSQTAIHMTDMMVGLGKGLLFGVLVAMAGCLRGLQCGRNASAVGLAATSAVVTAIVFIIMTDAIIDIILNLFGI